jgi:hypothetical protein
VDQYPAAVSTHRYRDRLHAGRALSLPITGDVAVEVPGPQRAGAAIAMGRSGGV